MMDAGGEGVIAGPDDFAFAGDFDHGDAGIGGVASDDGISVGEALGAAGIFEETADVVVGHFPDDVAVGIEFDDFVAVGEGGDSITVVEADGGEGPVFGLATAEVVEVGAEGADDGSVGGVFLDGEGEEMGDEEVAVAELAGHAGLHMGVVRFGLEGDIEDDGAGRIHFEKAGARTEFGHQGIAVVEALGGADFAVFLGECVGEDCAFIPGDLLHTVAEGEKDIAIGEHESVPGTPGEFPLGFSVFGDDRGFGAEDEVGMADGTGGGRIGGGTGE